MFYNVLYFLWFKIIISWYCKIKKKYHWKVCLVVLHGLATIYAPPPRAASRARDRPHFPLLRDSMEAGRARPKVMLQVCPPGQGKLASTPPTQPTARARSAPHTYPLPLPPLCPAQDTSSAGSVLEKANCFRYSSRDEGISEACSPFFYL